jgi:hypothetical protein
VFYTVFLRFKNTVWDNVLALEAAKDAPMCPLPANRVFDCHQKRRDRFENRSAIKHRPADLVSQPLIFQYEFTNRIRELFVLPAALEPTSMLSLSFGGRRTCCLDRLGRSTILVGSDMSHHPCLTDSLSKPRAERPRSTRLPQPWHGPRRAEREHPELASRPRPNPFHDLAGPQIQGLRQLEVVQNVLCTRNHPKTRHQRSASVGGAPRRIMTKRALRSSGRIMVATLLTHTPLTRLLRRGIVTTHVFRPGSRTGPTNRAPNAPGVASCWQMR